MFSELCKDTPRKRCTIPRKKMSGDSVLWVLTAILVVALIRCCQMTSQQEVGSMLFISENSKS